MNDGPDRERMLWRERVMSRPKHWVRVTTACNSRCLFCLDSDTPRNVALPIAEVLREIDRGIDEVGAERLILSGGEPTLHPEFLELVRHAKARGYERVQIVTNGLRLEDKRFFEACITAGLGEITFSLHGHTAELHDRLTGTPGAFRRLIKGLVRALRDGRPIVNVDVVINKQNVAVLDKIVELCIELGVTELDLLHVIPQGRAFEHRDELFYDVRGHLPVLQKVFRLGRHPRFVVWTNRFPVSFLEGLEDLIQDPHKLLDEVNGRRFQLRRYLDEGEPLDCRHPERCPHCFIEPFCTTLDRLVGAQNARSFEVFWVGDGSVPEVLPFGARALGVAVAEVGALRELGSDFSLLARVGSAEPLAADLGRRRPVRLIAETAEQLEAWLGRPLPDGVDVEIELGQRTAPWLLGHRARLGELLGRLSIHQPSHELLADATEKDIRGPRAFFQKLALPISVSGLPACLLSGAKWAKEREILPAALFDAATGRLDLRETARLHVSRRYRAKSVRCSDCRVSSRCEGAHINFLRDQGLAVLTPFVSGPDAERVVAELERLFPVPPSRLSTGAPPRPVAESLPGFAPPGRAPEDPLAIFEREREAKRAARRGLSRGDD